MLRGSMLCGKTTLYHICRVIPEKTVKVCRIFRLRDIDRRSAGFLRFVHAALQMLYFIF
jgi:hypothetical protein